MALYLQTSTARQKFKKMLGRANHRLITAMVGLDAIDRGLVVTVPEDFPARWAPRDPSASARWSRLLILEMALVRSVDALDVYISYTNRTPFLIQSPTIKCELDGTRRSVTRKFNVFEQHFSPKDKVLPALIATMIKWRNKAVHSEDSDKLEQTYKTILDKKADEIRTRFRGLETTMLLAGYGENRVPHLKEVTSFIDATHQYVHDVDKNILNLLDPEQYLRELVWTGVCETGYADDVSDSERKRLIRSKWDQSLDRKKQAVEGFLQHKGLSSTRPTADEHYVAFEDVLVEELVSRTPVEVYQWAHP